MYPFIPFELYMRYSMTDPKMSKKIINTGKALLYTGLCLTFMKGMESEAMIREKLVNEQKSLPRLSISFPIGI